MPFVPLTQAWGASGEASVTIAALEDAGFHPAIDCDPRGWMHFYGWPFGAPAPITLWIPAHELAEAEAFLAADCEPSWDAVDVGSNLVGLVFVHRRWLYAAWVFDVISFVAIAIGIQAAVGVRSRSNAVGGGSSDGHT